MAVACSPAGPRLAIDGPLPVAPPHSLLKTPGVVVEDFDEHILNGTEIRLAYDGGVMAWDFSALPSPPVKDEGDPENVRMPTFDPFAAYFPTTCSIFQYEWLREQSVSVLDARLSKRVERVLAAGVVGDSPYIGDSNANILASGAAVSPAVGLSYLENFIGAVGQRGLIHVTPAVAAAFEAVPVVGQSFETLETINGTPIVVGGGYIGTTPTGEASPGDGEDWIYASGDVKVYLGAMAVTDVQETLDRSDNSITFRAERVVLVTFDITIQAAVLVDWAS